MINGHDHSTPNGKPTSMMLEHQFDRDPLKKKKHKVLLSDDGGKNYTIMGEVDDPIELLKLEIQGQHAVGMPQTSMLIVDETSTVVADYPTYYVEPEEGAPNEARIILRDKWMDAVMRFLLPFALYKDKDKPNRQHRLQKWFKQHKIEVEMRPDGGAVRIWRDGEILTKWGC